MTKRVRTKPRKHPVSGLVDKGPAGRPVAAFRLPEELSRKVDAWADAQRDKPVRDDAIRRLLIIGLKAERSRRPISEEAAAKASRLAGETLDKLADPTATPDQRDSRKRRLLKGPREFR